MDNTISEPPTGRWRFNARAVARGAGQLRSSGSHLDDDCRGRWSLAFRDAERGNAFRGKSGLSKWLMRRPAIRTRR